MRTKRINVVVTIPVDVPYRKLLPPDISPACAEAISAAAYLFGKAKRHLEIGDVLNLGLSAAMVEFKLGSNPCA